MRRPVVTLQLLDARNAAPRSDIAHNFRDRLSLAASYHKRRLRGGFGIVSTFAFRPVCIFILLAF
jgi:hypothetical protein